MLHFNLPQKNEFLYLPRDMNPITRITTSAITDVFIGPHQIRGVIEAGRRVIRVVDVAESEFFQKMPGGVI